MNSTNHFTVTLPADIAQLVRAKIASGEYANESDVVCAGLRDLLNRDQALERRMLDHMTAADDTEADLAHNLSVDRVRASLTGGHGKIPLKK